MLNAKKPVVLAFATTGEAVAATTKKTEKVRLVAEYFLTRPWEEAAQAAIFLSGRAFPAWEERTLQAGGALLWRALAEVSGKSESELTAAYRRYGDGGSAAHDVLLDVAPKKSSLSVFDLRDAFDQLARTSSASQIAAIIADLLRRATPLESKYIVKIIGGDLRIGLRESLVEEAIAKAFQVPVSAVQRANMMLGDIAETLRLAAANQLDKAHMRLFHPVGFMLPSPPAHTQQPSS